MATYNFERLSVFIVEDNTYIRHVIEDLMRHLGVGRVGSATNGAEAIEHFKAISSSPAAARSIGADIVLSDLVMTPINGLLLLRWLRTSKESPDRFIPFIMLSGAADREYVESARNLGVTEFVAKPFSLEKVYQRFMEVIDYPRQFVMTHSYFGPDRRRSDMGAPGGDERRTTRSEDVTVVYSADKVIKPKDDKGVWLFRPQNRLKDKVGGLGSNEPGELPKDLLEKAEEKLERAQLDFTDWALSYLSQLSDLCTEALMKPGRRGAHFEKINLLALELRGQGGTFGYPLVTIMAKQLFLLTQEGCREDDNMVEIVKAHIDAMRAVIREKIRGDGGQVGRELLKGLKKAIDKNAVVVK